ncbi:hypothetical protein SLE2022_350070 [Rubroshorea leprosula]
MAATGVCVYATGYSPVSGGKMTSFRPILLKQSRTPAFAVSTLSVQASTVTNPKSTLPQNNGKFREQEATRNVYANMDELPEEDEGRKTLKDFFEACKEFIGSEGGPPRWFSPLECGCRAPDSPLLLFLPGIDGTGLGLLMHHQKLGKIFDIWCLHIPVKDRTSFTGLVQLVESTVRSEYSRSPNRPIYLVGESLGGCLALAVSNRNPDIDLLLILSNPATSFGKSQLKPLLPLLQSIPDEFFLLARNSMLSLTTGDHLRMLMDNVVKGIPLGQSVIGKLSQDIFAASSYLSVLVEILPKELLEWKLQMLKSASAYANSRLRATKAEVLLLCSGRDQLFPSEEEGERLRHALPNCEIRKFDESHHFLFLEDGIDLVTIIKGTSFYRRGKYHDCVSDYIPPTPAEFKKLYDSNRWLNIALSPVMLSTTEDGKVVKGLAGIPSEGPVLYVGYHMLLGIEVVPLVSEFLTQKNILLRGIAHPMLFERLREGRLPDVSTFDIIRLMGAVPVSGTNLYKLMSSKSHSLLFPGGVREALHRKGEAYKLFWPERSEFVRMATRFGAKIVPFGVVGADDFAEVIFDYNDQMKIPYFREFIEDLTAEAVVLRNEGDGEVANQQIYQPLLAPRFPGRYYLYFGKPIETQGRKQELRDKEKCHQLYLHIKSEVERCIAYLKEKREEDPYRNIVPRLMYQATHGFNSQVPFFDL